MALCWGRLWFDAAPFDKLRASSPRTTGCAACCSSPAWLRSPYAARNVRSAAVPL